MLDLQVITEGSNELAGQTLLGCLVEVWRRAGIHAAIGPFRRLDATMGIMHVDRTIVAPEHVPEVRAGQRLWNAAVLDISKRRVSSQLVVPGDGYEGPVILKTDNNSFGGTELALRSSFALCRIRRRLVPWLGWRWARELPRSTYPVLDRRGSVPGWVWQRQDLVVERFRPERVGDEFALRYWLFAGDRDCVIRLVGAEPVLKFKNARRWELLEGVPDELRAIRQRFGLDFGKLDYVMVDGQPVLLDVNKTPIVPAALRELPEVLRLAEGLRFGAAVHPAGQRPQG